MMRPLYLFYALLVYVLLQFGWWALLLVELNNEVYKHRIENVRLREADSSLASEEVGALRNKLHQRWWMITGEGLVFACLLTMGGIITYRSFKKEYELARQQKNFLLSVTHEFKSPLASIKLYLQTLQKHDLDKEKRDSFISSAVRDSDRLDALVENALLASMIDHKGYKFTAEEVNLSALSRLLAQKFNFIPEHRSKVELHVDDGLNVIGDKQALSLMINNLLENAEKYSTSGTIILLTASRKQDKIIVSVADHGPGIPDEEKKKVFKKFYRLGNEETRSTKGTGLGLFLVREIAEHHHAMVSITDNKPKGSIFTAEFPADL